MILSKTSYRDLAICAGLVVITLAVYWQVGTFDFVNYDDPMYVYDNLHVREGLSWENVGWAFTTMTTSNWHPLTWLSYMLDVQLFGLNSGAHHWINLAFHVANTLLLFLVLRGMTAAVWKSAMVAALFAIHPLHVESVAWIAERKDVLSTFFCLLTLAAYVRYIRNPNLKRYALVFVLFALGLLAKSMLVTLPFLLLLLDYWPLGRLRKPVVDDQPKNAKQPEGSNQSAIAARKSEKDRRQRQAQKPDESESLWPTAGRLVLEKIPLFMLAVILSVVTWISAHQKAMASLEYISFGARVANVLFAYVGYLGKTIWPLNLALPYAYQFHPDTGQILLAAVLLAGISAAAIWAWWSHRPYLTVGWFWYLGTLVPVIGIVQVGVQSMADRYTYIPLIGIFIAAVWGLAELIAPWDRRHLAQAAFAIAVLAACFLRTRDQVQYWRDTEILFLHAIDVIPRNITAHKNLMVWYWEQKKPAEATVHTEALLKINPRNAEAQTHLALVFIEQEKWDEAADHLKIALEVDHSSAAAHNHYGVVLFAKGDAEGAIQHLRESVRLDPEDVRPRQNLARICFASGKLEEAAQQWREVLLLEPRSVEAAGSLGAVLQKLGKNSEAVAFHRRALEADPKNVDVLNNLATALLALGKTDQALAQWRELIRLQPEDVVALNAMAWIQATSADQSLRNSTEAVQMAEKAVQLAQDASPDMLDTLAAAYAEAGRFAEAVATASKAVELASSTKNADLADKVQARLELYRSQKPYREPPDR